MWTVMGIGMRKVNGNENGNENRNRIGTSVEYSEIKK
jgi:hypothetical protein